MTDLLEKAFEEAAKLPPEAQDELAKWVLAEMEAEERWSQLLGSSADHLSELADEALSEHRRADTEALDPESL
jgi:hypothetical protein